MLRKENILNYINLTKDKVVKVSQLMDFQQLKMHFTV